MTNARLSRERSNLRWMGTHSLRSGKQVSPSKVAETTSSERTHCAEREVIPAHFFECRWRLIATPTRRGAIATELKIGFMWKNGAAYRNRTEPEPWQVREVNSNALERGTYFIRGSS